MLEYNVGSFIIQGKFSSEKEDQRLVKAKL